MLERGRSRSWHLHAGLWLVALLDGRSCSGVLLPGLDLVVLLDDSAAGAPERYAAVVEAAALDIITLAYLAALEQRIAGREERDVSIGSVRRREYQLI